MNAVTNLPDDAGTQKSVTDRVMELRDQLFGIQAVVDVVKQAISLDDDYSQHRALRDAVEAMDALASDMELLAGDVRRLEAKGMQS